MPIEAIPLLARAIRYLDVGEASELATVLPELASWNAADDDARSAALVLASADVDSAMPYQGRPVVPDQPLQFPRVFQDDGVGPGDLRPADVWGWDGLTKTAVVPRDVKLAVLFQADSILDRTREARLAAQHDGVVYSLTGTVAESYKQSPGPGVMSGLCRRAFALMKKYRLRSGRIV